MSHSPTYFATPADFRAWLEQHHPAERELWVGFRRVGTGEPSITWPESVDEALCFGWIDGLRKTVDERSYMIRFTPRRDGSRWSAVNVKRAEELIRSGRMSPAGLRAFEARDPEMPPTMSTGRRPDPELPAEALARLQGDEQAWRYFQTQPPGYRKAAFIWIMDAKREETRLRRLEKLIQDSAAGRRISPLL